MKKYFALGLRLAAFVAMVVAMLSVVNVFTRDTIARRRNLEGEQARAALMPGSFSEMTDFVVPEDQSNVVTAVYRAEQDGTVVGYCFDVTVKGYNEITMVVGVNTDLTVTGVTILSQAETPGIGSKVVDEEGVFLPQFKSLSSRNLDSVSVISGATISSKAIKNGVSSAVSVCSVILEEKGE